MYVAGEQQREIATIRPRTITLKLSDADCERIAKEAEKAGLMKHILIMSNGAEKKNHNLSWRDELSKLKGGDTE